MSIFRLQRSTSVNALCNCYLQYIITLRHNNGEVKSIFCVCICQVLRDCALRTFSLAFFSIQRIHMRCPLYTWKSTLKYVNGSHQHLQTQIKNRRECFHTNPLWQISNILSYCEFHTVFHLVNRIFRNCCTLFPIYMAESEMPVLIDCVWMLRIVRNYFSSIEIESISSMKFFWNLTFPRVLTPAPPKIFVMYDLPTGHSQKG